jgi:hypothetical protein
LEYDIREIDEDLYLAVLAYRLGQSAGAEGDLAGCSGAALGDRKGQEGTGRA